MKTIWESDGTDGPVLICCPPEKKEERWIECGRLGLCRIESIESFHTIVVEKDGKYYRVSGLSVGIPSVSTTPDTTYARLRR